MSATATAARRISVYMVLAVPKVPKVHLDRSGDRDGVPDAIRAVEGHCRDRRDDLAAGHELHERRLLLGDVTHELEADRRGCPDAHQNSHCAVKWKRDVHSGRV